MWRFCYLKKPLRHRISSQEVLQLRDGEAELSSFAIAVLNAGLVLSHSSVMKCDFKNC